MKILSVYTFPHNNQWYWAWRDEYTNDYQKTYHSQKEALQEKPADSQGDIYTYSIIYPD